MLPSVQAAELAEQPIDSSDFLLFSIEYYQPRVLLRPHSTVNTWRLNTNINGKITCRVIPEEWSYLPFASTSFLFHSSLMAPMAINAPSFKRTSTTAEFEFPVAKKQNRGTWHHHKPTWNLESSRRFNAPCQDDKAIQSLLSRSIGLALDAVGFEAAESIALESFRAQVEECTSSFTRTESRRLR